MGLDPTEGPRHTTGLIGGRRKRGDALTRAVLIGREAWPYCPFPLHWTLPLHAPPWCAAFPPRAQTLAERFDAGGHGVGAIPVPIPNTEVKPHSADDSGPAPRK